ncbi:endothelial PAS domain-containing protein 1-like isoform X2 [Phyllopteryx taeniolatus]|uniref:endothelial PAS domain-containing protein 1-like isoform X2 n=1 Tax=Phyllopteryx taeniolatus TaxID=161469 RepID=UPI002AD40B84|nr:endothelial PAS domain-containing protein 1-like isoform X2 [Phyllopteryx taeniolatus]
MYTRSRRDTSPLLPGRAISREAARKRRRVESDVFADLVRLLPLRASVRAHLDKPTVIRLALCYIRLKTLLKDAMYASKFFMRGADLHQNLKDEMEAVDETDVYLRVLEGFVMVLSSEGDMMFLSDNVGRYLGLTQTELMGHNVFEFTHPCDHEEIRSNLRLSAEEFWSDAKRDFVVRIKSTLTLTGRSTNLKSATWKVLQCQGRTMTRADPFLASCLLLICRPLPVSHTLLCSRTFSSQHSMDMRFMHCDHRVTSILGYTPHELVGRSIYELCHTLDTVCLSKYHINLYTKSQSVSGRYRMLVRGGGYVWAESHSAVVPGPRAPKSRAGALRPLLIFCVTYVLSVEEPFLQLSLEQNIQHRYVSCS